MHNVVDLGVPIIAIVAVSVSGASLYVSRVILPAKMKRAYLRSITALAAAVETKDSGTVGHAQRVAKLTKSMAQRLGMSGKDLDRIEYAALLRDIGKANIPQAILNKTTPLTEEEWAVVKDHAALGADMVSNVPFLAGCADMIRHHHECWNGSGYPDGLKGDEIPLESRILALASDFDAMISTRPYHPAPLSVDEAIDEIRAGSGARYDPVVVEVVLDILVEWQLEQSEIAQAA